MNENGENIALNLVKDRLGIRSSVRDSYLMAIIESVESELENHQGIKIDVDSPDELMFLVDYVTYRYLNVSDSGGMPKNIYWRMKNLFIKKNGESKK